MAFDQKITYKVNLDDADFQAKLSQMRASVDMTMGAAGGFGGGFGGMAPQTMMGGMINMRSNRDMTLGGIADFGASIRPVTYTPPAIAMQPHFGQIQVQQSLAQAGFGSFGAPGIAAYNAVSGAAGMGRSFLTGAPFHMPELVPQQISAVEYGQISGRNFATRAGDMATSVGMGGLSLAGGMVTGGLGAMAGTALMGGAIAPIAGALAAGMAFGKYTDSVSTMLGDNKQIQSALGAGSFRFLTGGPDLDKFTGRGFSRDARNNVAKFIQREELGDQRFGMDEYKQILEGGMQTDLFSGTQDVEQFKGKFKGLVDNLKTITSTLHTSLKEGMEVIRGFRDMGVTDPGQVNQLTMKAEALGRASGRTGMEMLAVGQTGAEIFRGTGVNMQLGFETNMQNTNMVRHMLNNGAISRETVGQAGGELSLAQQMTSNALASTQTAVGRAFMMANFNPANGTLDANFMTKNAGKDAMSMVAGAAGLGASSLIKFEAHQEEMVGKMSPMQLQLFGVQTGMASAMTIANATGAGVEDSYRFWQMRQGKSKALVDTELAMIKMNPEEFKKQQETQISMVGHQAAKEEWRNRHDLMKGISNTVRDYTVRPVAEALSDMGTAVSKGVENAIASVTGIKDIDTSMVNKASVEAGEKLLGKQRYQAGYVDNTGGWADKFLGNISGRGLAEDALKFGETGKDGSVEYMGGKLLKFKDAQEAADFAAKNKTKVVGLKTLDDGTLLAAEQTQLDLINKTRSKGMTTAADVEKASKFQIDSEAKDILEGMVQAERGGKQIGIDEVGQMMFGDAYGKDGETGFQTAVLNKVAGKYGLKYASEQLKARQSQSAVGASEKTAQMSMEEANAATDSIKASLRKGMGKGWITDRDKGSFVDKMDMNQLGIAAQAADVFSKSGDSKEYRALKSQLRDTFGDDGANADAVTDVIEKDKTARGNLIKNVSIANVKHSEFQNAKSGMQGGDQAAIGGPLGEVTKDAVTQMQNMSNQLVENMKALVALQEKFKLGMRTTK